MFVSYQHILINHFPCEAVGAHEWGSSMTPCAWTMETDHHQPARLIQ